MDKTVVVAVQWQQRHPLYGKVQRRTTKFYAHDGDNRCTVGDLVKIEETRALSRLKRWRVIDLLEQREVAEVKPVELDQSLLEAQRRGQAEEVAAEETSAPPEAAVAEEAKDEVAEEPREEAEADESEDVGSTPEAGLAEGPPDEEDQEEAKQ
jgi:small subunit ribosomal protein S17